MAKETIEINLEPTKECPVHGPTFNNLEIKTMHAPPIYRNYCLNCVVEALDRHGVHQLVDIKKNL